MSAWESRPLGQIAAVRLGRTPSGLDRYLATTHTGPREIPFFKVGDMNAHPTTLQSARTHLSADDVTALRVEVLPTGAIVFPKAGGAIATNKKRVLGIPGAVDLNCMAVVTGPLLDPRYLRLWFEALDLTSIADGSVLPQISKKRVLALQVPVPPRGEQKRIVDILEDHLSRLDAAEQLTHTDHRSDAFAAATVQRALAGTGGESYSLASLAVGVENGIFVSRAKSEPDGVPILRIGSVRPMLLDPTSVGYSRLAEHDLADRGALLEAGDLLFTRYNGNRDFVGACAVVPPALGPLTYPDKLIRVRVDEARVLPEFVALTVTYGPARTVIRSMTKTTAGQTGIAGRDLKSVRLAVPPLAEQQRVIDAGLEALAAVRGLQRSTTELRQHSASLRHALLGAAFSGHLTGRASETDGVEKAPHELQAARVVAPALGGDSMEPTASGEARSKERGDGDASVPPQEMECSL